MNYFLTIKYNYKKFHQFLVNTHKTMYIEIEYTHIIEFGVFQKTKYLFPSHQQWQFP
jgi:hypothetical protein